MLDLKCFLIGPNGSGKSTVGRMLADFLSLKFVDCDRELENLCGKKVADFWQEKGVQIFSKFENMVVNALAIKKNMIFAASVHSITDLANRKLFTNKGKIIYLSTDPVNQYTRFMLSNHQSPVLSKVDNKLMYLMELAKTMEPLYNSIADFIIPTDNCSAEEVANKIIDYLYSRIYG